VKITSTSFADNEIIPTVYTCLGANVNPPLEFDDIPTKTTAFALTVVDQDATPKPWVHWFVYNIPPDTIQISENNIPSGATEGFANGGTPGYEGPCPKYFTGTHLYVFTLYALSLPLDIDPTSTFADAAETIHKHTIETATLRGLAEGTGEGG
jgi:Raf kinase inhibitor-like YbhB/YbcL family protein